MNKALQIFRRDIMRLLRNPVALVITIGVCVIPSLYAWYNIVANWDPYANTANIKIAVANEDEGTTNEYTGTMNAGEQVIEQLRKNDQLGWTFTDAKEAKEGVYRGDYYAGIIIPKDFSEKLTSMLTGEFTEPKLVYYVNEKKNAIAPKVTDTGASTIQEQINSTFVSTVSKTLVKTLQDVGTIAKDKGADAESGILANTAEARKALDKVRSALSGMQDSVDATKDAVTSADTTLGKLNDQLPQLVQALDEGDTLLATTRTTSRDFSTSLSSALSGANRLMGKASSTASAAVGKVSTTVVMTQGYVDDSATALDGVVSDIDDLKELINGTLLPDDAKNKLVSQLQDVQGGINTLADSLHRQASAITDTATKVNNASTALDTAVQTGISTIDAAHDSVNSTALPKLSAGLDSFSDVSGDLTGVIASLEPVIAQTRGTLSQLNATLDQAKTAIAQTDGAVADVQGSLDDAATDIRALQSSQVMDELSELLGVNASDVSDFMSSPVTLNTQTVYPVSNYGSGVAPFYTNLALWVGGFVLIAIIKLEVDPEGVGEFNAKEGYFGRWLLLVLLGFVQAVIVCVGDLVLGTQCHEPVLFVLAGVWTSFVYVNIIYALSITFKHIGKALGVILVIVQIPGSSGMYPIEMMPGFYQWLHPFLPFTYGINALRETIGGMYGMYYWANLAVLGVFLVLALVVGLVLRPFMLNLNLLFDRQLSTTGVMLCESNNLPNPRFSVRLAMRALLDGEGYRDAIVARATRFEQAYPARVRAGFCMVLGLPMLLFLLTWLLDLSNDGKIVMLVLWIVVVVLADTYLINLEYVRESLNTQMRVSALSDDKLREEIRRHTAALPSVARMFGVQVQSSAPRAGASGESAEGAAADAGAEKGGEADA